MSEQNPLEIDADQIATFVDAVLRHASTGVYISLRSFPDDGARDGPPFNIEAVKLNGGGLEPLAERAAIEAKMAARATRGIVFGSPIAGFDNPHKADQASLVEGYTITAELDARPTAALAAAVAVLGAPTVVTASG